MQLILKTARAEVWQVGDSFYVYGGSKLLRVCPSVGMAREIAAGA